MSKYLLLIFILIFKFSFSLNVLANDYTTVEDFNGNIDDKIKYIDSEKKEHEYKSLLRDKFEYYTGKAEPSIYQEKPFDLKVLKSDLGLYMDSDPELQLLQTRINYYEEIMFFLEKVLQCLNNRGFQIKNSIDWQKFMQGSI